MTRREALKVIYNSLYKPLQCADPDDYSKCFYCGCDSAGYDHQPPLSMVQDMITAMVDFEPILVPSCAECNRLLSNFPTKTLKERMDLLKDILKRKYRSHIRAALIWNEELLLDVGYTLRKMILSSITVGIETQKRIAYPGHSLIPSLYDICPNIILCPYCLSITMSVDGNCMVCGERLSGHPSIRREC